MVNHQSAIVFMKPCFAKRSGCSSALPTTQRDPPTSIVCQSTRLLFAPIIRSELLRNLMPGSESAFGGLPVHHPANIRRLRLGLGGGRFGQLFADLSSPSQTTKLAALESLAEVCLSCQLQCAV